MSYADIASHRRMALDQVRNEAYALALRQVVTPDSVVVDLGAGVGVHGLMAAKMGARKVYLIEQEDVIAVAEENVRANGLQHVVECIHGRVEDVQLPERADVIVSVLTGHFLLTEDLLPTLFHARDHMLKPGGVLLPSHGTMEIVPVSAPQLHDREIAAWSTPAHGIDLSPSRAYASNAILYSREDAERMQPLASAVELHAVDFMLSDYESLKADVSVTIEQPGDCHGWLGWFRMKLGDRWLSTSPRESRVHWNPAFFPIDPPLPLAEGDRVRFQLSRPPYGDWTWRMTAPSGQQRHSTMLAAPMKASSLQKAALDYRPTLTAHGLAVARVLAECAAHTPLYEIAERVRVEFSDRYQTSDAALRFVRGVVKWYA